MQVRSTADTFFSYLHLISTETKKMPTYQQWAFFRLKDLFFLGGQRHLLVDAELVVLENVLST